MSARDPNEPPQRPLGFLLKHSAIYSAAPILRYAISIGMTRLYTGWLGRSGYGVKENADLWAIGLQQVLGFNVLASMVRFYYDQRTDRDRAAVVTSCTVVVTLAAVLLCSLALFFVPELTPWMLGQGAEVSDRELLWVCTLLLVLVPFQLATMSGLYYLQTVKRPGLYTSVQTAKLLLEVTLNFYWIGARGLGVRGWLLSMLIGEIVTAGALCGWILWTLRPRVDWRILRPILRYAAPMVPVGLLQLLLHNFDRRLMLEFGGQALAGTYGFGFKLASLVVQLVLGPFVLTFQPWIFGLESAQERARMVAKVGTYGILIVGGASLGVILFGRQAAQILAGDPGFWEAYRVVPFVSVGYVFWALYHVSQMPLFLEKRTGPLLLVNALAVALSVGLNLVLIPALGIVGASIAALVTFASLAGMGMWVGRRAAGVSFELARLGAILLAVGAGGGCALWIDALEDADRCPLWLALSAKGMLLAALLLALWSWVLDGEERGQFRGWVTARWRGRFRSRPEDEGLHVEPKPPRGSD